MTAPLDLDALKQARAKMTMGEERCPVCDQPKGDQDRADALPITCAWLAQKRGGPRLKWSDVTEAQRADQPGMCIESQCKPVDWRARCLAAESERDRLRAVAVEALDRAHHDDRCNQIMGWGDDCPCDCRVRDLRAALETP